MSSSDYVMLLNHIEKYLGLFESNNVIRIDDFLNQLHVKVGSLRKAMMILSKGYTTGCFIVSTTTKFNPIKNENGESVIFQPNQWLKKYLTVSLNYKDYQGLTDKDEDEEELKPEYECLTEAFMRTPICVYEEVNNNASVDDNDEVNSKQIILRKIQDFHDIITSFDNCQASNDEKERAIIQILNMEMFWKKNDVPELSEKINELEERLEALLKKCNVLGKNKHIK